MTVLTESEERPVQGRGEEEGGGRKKEEEGGRSNSAQSLFSSSGLTSGSTLSLPRLLGWSWAMFTRCLSDLSLVLSRRAESSLCAESSNSDRNSAQRPLFLPHPGSFSRLSPGLRHSAPCQRTGHADSGAACGGARWCTREWVEEDAVVGWWYTRGGGGVLCAESLFSSLGLRALSAQSLLLFFSLGLRALSEQSYFSSLLWASGPYLGRVNFSSPLGLRALSGQS